MKTLFGLAVAAALLAGVIGPRRRRRARVAETWAAETDRV